MKRLLIPGLSVSFRLVARAFCFLLFVVFLFYFSRPDPVDYSRQNTILPGYLNVFISMDPLVGVSTALAARAFNWSLAAAGAILLVCMIFPRWFCGYVCPMGTLMDIFDWSVGRHVKRFRVKTKGGISRLRFYLLGVIFVAALCGVLLSGFVAAIPVLTRGFVYLFAPLQDGLSVGWESVPGITLWQVVSITGLVSIVGLGLLRPRFWCAYLCPSGALLSLASGLSLRRRIVEKTCNECGRCARECPFDAIDQDGSTRTLACTACGRCQSICPNQSIQFVWRWIVRQDQSLCRKTDIGTFNSRRTFLLGLIGAAGTGAGAAIGVRYEKSTDDKYAPIRPPGALPEARFLTQCIRCGECLQVCPGYVLRPAGFELGIDGIWTPMIKADFAGCQPFCNNCGQVCPTGAIRKLPIEEKRAARIGLAEVNTLRCLPHCQKENCGLCLEACAAAGYHAIEYVRVGIQYDEQGNPLEDSGFLAPVILKEKCIGCGLCQARCYAANVRENRVLQESAVKVTAGADNEDRMVTGSYKTLRHERINRDKQNQSAGTEDEYLPDFLR